MGKVSQKRKKNVTPSICSVNGGEGRRQASIMSFFGNPSKKLVTPQTAPSKKASQSQRSSATLTPSSSEKKTTGAAAPASPNNQSPTLQRRKRHRVHKSEQLYLDFGQASFGKQTQCPHCGTLYVEGVPEDLAAHERVCSDFKDGISLRITPALRSSKDVVHLEGSAFVIEVKASHGITLRKKVSEVQLIAERELGFAPGDCDEAAEPRRLDLSVFTYFLYVDNQRIVGLLVTESITQAFVATDVAGSAACSSGKSHKAVLGVHLLWVHSQQRGKGIATRLLDVARDRLVFGYTSLPPHKVAFSSPTEGGQRFAKAYLRKREATGPLLVYQFATHERR